MFRPQAALNESSPQGVVESALNAHNKSIHQRAERWLFCVVAVKGFGSHWVAYDVWSEKELRCRDSGAVFAASAHAFIFPNLGFGRKGHGHRGAGFWPNGRANSSANANKPSKTRRMAHRRGLRAFLAALHGFVSRRDQFRALLKRQGLRDRFVGQKPLEAQFFLQRGVGFFGPCLSASRRYGALLGVRGVFALQLVRGVAQ